jgi:tetratricopeptide (TPR) repeat protein
MFSSKMAWLAVPLRLLRLLFLVLLAGSAFAGRVDAPPKNAANNEKINYRPNDPLNAAAFEHFYNLDYERSITEFTQVLQRHPDDPFAVNHLLVAVLFKELDRIGALNSGDYSNDLFVSTARLPADPNVKQKIKELVDRAAGLEEKKLTANPNDVDALYARGVTRAQSSTYTGLVERAWFSALRNAIGARRDHERVLELDPNYTQAKLIVGTHNYVIGSLPWAVKAAVSVAGLGGSKEKGIEYLRQAASASGETAVDAKILLLLFLRREHQFDEALQISRTLIPVYPQNLLMALEEGNLLRAAGRNAEASAVYRRIWQAGRDGRYPGLHYELAALSLGDLLRSQKDYPGAISAYEQVTSVPKPESLILQKANLGAGEAYDAIQKRDLAVQKYQAVLASNSASPQAEAARKCLKEPCRNN